MRQGDFFGPLLVFWKSFIWDKSGWSAAQFQYILISLNLACNKNKLYKVLDYWFRDMLNFDSLEKGPGKVSSHIVHSFSWKMFFMLYSLNWQNYFIAWSYLPLEILGNICIAVVCFPGCDETKFEINLVFLIKLYFYMTRKLRQKFKHLGNEKSF